MQLDYVPSLMYGELHSWLQCRFSVGGMPSGADKHFLHVLSRPWVAVISRASSQAACSHLLNRVRTEVPRQFPSARLAVM